jgi:hypothetical protein
VRIEQPIDYYRLALKNYYRLALKKPLLAIRAGYHTAYSKRISILNRHRRPAAPLSFCGNHSRQSQTSRRELPRHVDFNAVFAYKPTLIEPTVPEYFLDRFSSVPTKRVNRKLASMFRAVVVKLLVSFGGCCSRSLHSPVNLLEFVPILYAVMVDQSVDCSVIPRHEEE